jgi:tetratricopeptide (TPR) repeat protein
MNAILSRVLAASFTLVAALGSAGIANADPDIANSSTVIGPNAMLSDGANALLAGEWERGVQLTQMGLATATSREDRAAGLANLCAGFTALKQYKRALEYCDQSLAILDGNWRTWQNRAAANIGLGKIEDSMRDIQRGLQINPDADALQKTLAIARDYEKLQQERMQHLVES